MRWSALLLVLAGICALVQVVRGVVVYDGVSLLGVAFLAAAAIAALLTRAASRAARPSARRFTR